MNVQLYALVGQIKLVIATHIGTCQACCFQRFPGVDHELFLKGKVVTIYDEKIFDMIHLCELNTILVWYW